MTHYITSMPLWLVVLFSFGFFFSLVFISGRFSHAAIKGGMSPGKSRNIQLGILLFFIAYFAYVAVLALNGLLDKDTLPPMVMIYAAVPLAIFLFGFVGNTRLYKNLLRMITLESLITIHVFRVIGIYFILLYFYHLLPVGFAFSAGLGDIITAVLALPVAIIYSKGKSWRIPVVYAWNILGMFDIVNLLVIAIIIVKNTLATGAPGIREIDLFPFSWFPAFAPPVLLFLHVMVFKKIKQLKKNNYETMEKNPSLKYK